jgi:hypothetical protein
VQKVRSDVIPSLTIDEIRQRPVQKMSFAIFETSRLIFFESRMIQGESICYGMPLEKLQFRRNSTLRRRTDQGRVQQQAATLQSKTIYDKPLCKNSSWQSEDSFSEEECSLETETELPGLANSFDLSDSSCFRKPK